MDGRTNFLTKSLNEGWNSIKDKLQRSRAVTGFYFDKIVSFTTDPLDCILDITDGSQDGGLDGYFVDRPNRTLYLVQCKWYGPGKFKLSNKESLELLSFYENRLVPDNKSGALSTEVKRFIGKFHRFWTQYDVKLVYLTNTPLEDGALKRYKRKAFAFQVVGTRDMAQIYKEKLSEQIKIETQGVLSLAVPDIFELDTVYPLSEKVQVKIKVVQCAIRGIDLKKAFQEYDIRLFSRNLRFGLKGKINQGIKETAETARRDSFYVLHNGISIVCSKYRILDIGTKAELAEAIKKMPDRWATHVQSSYGMGVKRFIWLDKFQIINGAQTTITLAEVSDADLETISIPCKISMTDDEEISSQIAICNNTQNRIKPWDLVANSEELTLLQNYAALALDPSFFIIRRRGEKWSSLPLASGKAPRRRRRIEAEKAYQAFLAFNGSPGQAYVKKGTVLDPTKSMDPLRPQDPSRSAYSEISNYPDLDLIVLAGYLPNLESECADPDKDENFAKWWSLWLVAAYGHLFHEWLPKSEQVQAKKTLLSDNPHVYWKKVRIYFLDAFKAFLSKGPLTLDGQRIMRNIEDEWETLRLRGIKPRDIWSYINKQFRATNFSDMRKKQGSNVRLEFYEVNFAILARFLDLYMKNHPPPSV